jgi:hypothetical protein
VKADKEEVKIAIAVKGKTAGGATNTPKDVKLKKEEITITLKADADATESTDVTEGVAAVEKIIDKAKAEVKDKLKAEVKDGKVTVTAAKDTTPGDYWVVLKSTEKAKDKEGKDTDKYMAGANLTVKVVAAGTTPPPPPPEKVEFVGDTKDLAFKVVDKDSKFTIEIKGKVTEAKFEAEAKGLKVETAEKDKKWWVVVTVTDPAIVVPGEVTIWIIGKGDDNKASVKLKIAK